MKKKLLALLLSAITIVGGLSGCSKANQAQEATPNTTGGAENTTESTGEITNIVWQWPSLGATGSGFQAVEDALNAMMEKDIGVHVTLEPVNVMDLVNQTTLAVTSGDQVDLSLQISTGLSPYVSSGLIQPIDEYIDEYGAAIKEKCGVLLSGGYYQDKLYGVPVAYISGNSYGYQARKDILDKYGITVDPNKLYTIEDIEQIFATVKAGEGDKFYMYMPGNNYYMLNGAYCEIDPFGSVPAGGVLMLDRSFSDLSIVNLFETDEYKKYAEFSYDWAQKGYISSDAATNTEDGYVLLTGGNYLGGFTWSTPNREAEVEAATGLDLVTFKMVDPYVVDPVAGVSWQVPITSVNPAKAIQALNYIYENPEANKLLQFGIEGQDYEVVDKNDNGEQIKFLADDPNTLPYYTPFGVFGNRLAWPAVAPASMDMNQILIDWQAAIPQEKYSPAVGYVFDAQSVSTEYSAVSAVITQYLSLINCGAMDPTESLPEFQSALKAAGIDSIIAENQRQVDEWAAKNK